MVNKKVLVLTAGMLGLGGLAALNEPFASAEENTTDTTEETTDVFDWMRERMGQGFHGFVNRDNENGNVQPGMGSFRGAARRHMGGGMHGGRMHGAGNGFGPYTQEFQDEDWLEEHDELRRDHFETMHPEWDEESLEERESFRDERRQNNRRQNDDSAE